MKTNIEHSTSNAELRSGEPDLPMVARFIRSRWSETRQKIDAMEIGQVLEFPWEEYFNSKVSVDRSNHAYAGTRKWNMTIRSKLRITVTREI